MESITELRRERDELRETCVRVFHELRAIQDLDRPVVPTLLDQAVDWLDESIRMEVAR